jgi:uncharacterized protein (DUF433 family)
MVERITVNPNIHLGKPCVAGTRITVQSVRELLGEGLSFDEIVRDYYPDLAVEDIQACIQYAISEDFPGGNTQQSRPARLPSDHRAA